MRPNHVLKQLVRRQARTCKRYPDDLRWKRASQVNDYATAEDFCGVFAEGMDELYQPSFLLIADHHKAEQCFVAGLEDSLKKKHVFKQRARSWAKRAIIQNAILELEPCLLATSFSLARHS